MPLTVRQKRLKKLKRQLQLQQSLFLLRDVDDESALRINEGCIDLSIRIRVLKKQIGYINKSKERTN